MPTHCVGMLIQNRWDLTHNALMSIYYSDQPKGSYDLFLIDNASDQENVEQLKDFVNSGLVPVKNAYFFANETSISRAWNLFLALTQDYDYRVKFDNDLVLMKTITPSTEPKSDSPIPDSNPAEVDPLAGAPRSGTIIGGVNSPTSRLQSRTAGIGTRNKLYSVSDNSSRFLDHLTGFSKEYEVDVAALAPVPPKSIFPSTMQDLSNREFGGRSYLMGGCMQISKKAFDVLGYFDERLPRRIDLEYSQRAIRNKINIGYHPDYWVVHMGANQPTDEKAVRDQKIALATSIIQQQPITSYANSQWEKVLRQIQKASMKYKIVNVE